MGDRLKNELGIASEWTENEINQYKSIHSSELGPVYLIENIPNDSPANRVRLWDKKLEIRDNSDEEKHILKISKEQGKTAALRELEKIAIERFF